MPCATQGSSRKLNCDFWNSGVLPKRFSVSRRVFGIPLEAAAQTPDLHCSSQLFEVDHEHISIVSYLYPYLEISWFGDAFRNLYFKDIFICFRRLVPCSFPQILSSASLDYLSSHFPILLLESIQRGQTASNFISGALLRH